jgi:hypothetical protein
MNLEKNKGSKVLNKNAAPIQLTAEQLILKTKERQEKEIQPAKLRIIDADELDDFRFIILCAYICILALVHEKSLKIKFG